MNLESAVAERWEYIISVEKATREVCLVLRAQNAMTYSAGDAGK
jgi:hypothetical protein